MMKILLLLCGFVVLAVARPTRPHISREMTRPHISREILSRLFRSQKHDVRDHVSDVSDQACGVALSNAMAEILDHIDAIPTPMPILHMKGKLKEISVRIFGFDIVDDEKARVEAFCKLSQAKDVAGLKIAMEEYDYNLFRLGYDYMAITIPLGSQDVPPPISAAINTMESLGLTTLDPEGVEWCLDISNARDVYEMLTAGYVPAPPSGDNFEQKCLTLQELVAQYLSTLATHVPSLAANVRHWTGIDIHDEEQLPTLLCDLLAAAEEGLEAVYDVIEGYGIIDHGYQAGYPLVVEGAKIAKQQLNGLLDMFESMLNTIPNGNEPPVRPQYENQDFLVTNELPGQDHEYPSYEGYPFNDESSYGGPSYGGPSHGGPSYGGPSHDGPSYGGPPYGGPSHGGPSYGGPSHGGPSYGGPSYGGPPYGGPSHGGPPYGGPPYGGPSHGGPSHGGPPDGGPPPGGPDPAALLELIRATIKLLDALEDSGLLSLA